MPFENASTFQPAPCSISAMTSRTGISSSTTRMRNSPADRSSFALMARHPSPSAGGHPRRSRENLRPGGLLAPVAPESPAAPRTFGILPPVNATEAPRDPGVVLFRREIHLTYTRIQDIHLTSNL